MSRTGEAGCELKQSRHQLRHQLSASFGTQRCAAQQRLGSGAMRNRHGCDAARVTCVGTNMLRRGYDCGESRKSRQWHKERARMLYEFGDARVRMRAFRLLHMVARRGNSRDFPENTLAALRSAIALGARFVEIDVHLSSDAVPMVVHDRQLAGVANFAEMSAAQLGALDVSQSERFGERFSGARIASLASTLGVLDGRPEITAFIVIGQTSVIRFGRNRVVSQVARALKPVRSRCVLASMDLPTIHAARTMFGYPIAWVLPNYDGHTRLKYEALQPEYLFCDRAYLPPKDPLWRGPWRWVIYEAEMLDTVLELASRGADFVVTRDVRALSGAMRAHAAANLAARADAARAATTAAALAAATTAPTLMAAATPATSAPLPAGGSPGTPTAPVTRS